MNDEKKKLSSEIRAYGYQYSIKSAIITYIVIVALTIGLGRVYELTVFLQIVIGIAAGAMAPLLLKNAAKRKLQQHRFSDANIYMEQMMYAFLRVPIVKDALEDTIIVFPEGPMHDTLEEALNIYQQVELKEDVNKIALGIILERYENDRMKRLHDYICKVERIGNNYKAGIEVQLKDRSEWVEAVCEHQVNMRKYKNMVIVSIMLIICLCAMPTYMMSSMSTMTSLASMPIYEIVTTVFLIAELLVYVITDKRMSIDWLNEKDRKDRDLEEQYIRAITFNKTKEFGKSVLYALVPFGVLIYNLLVSHSTFGIVVAAALTIVMLCQHNFGHTLNVRLVRRELEKAFPSWLMEIVLYLQTENVQVAIYKSVPSAPDILQVPVKKLVEELSNNPESIEPYTNFLKEFAVPEIQEAMKRFYSISTKGVGDIDKQIMELIDRNNGMMRKAERMKYKDKEGGMYGLMLLPQLPGLLEFIVGFYALIILFLNSFSA